MYVLNREIEPITEIVSFNKVHLMLVKIRYFHAPHQMPQKPNQIRSA